MKTLDLFSGVGGITYALRGGIADTVQYCDIDPFARAVLEANMRRGRIPRAPISDDVRSLHGKDLGKIEMIVAGFPCVGMSSIGLREGFKNEQSALFTEVLRLIDETHRPDYIFLENVPGIMKRGMKKVVKELHHKRKYELVWGIVGAWQVGAPHMRDRWFMLAKRPDAKPRVLDLKQYTPFPWEEGETVPRMTYDCRQEHRLRFASMGNGVCPDAVRTAFVLLASECKEKRLCRARKVHLRRTKMDPEEEPVANPCVTRDAQFPRFGCILASPRSKTGWGPMYALPDPLPRERPDLKLVIIPPVIKSRRGLNPLIGSTILKKPVSIARWATPRYGNTGAVNVLTERTVLDLASQIRYERKTPASLKGGHVNGEFVEWMQGYPKGYTKPW
jgi:site-specific DNA-cytosine methylase